MKSDESYIRPRLELNHAIELRELAKKIVVANVFDSQLTEDDIKALRLFEYKLTELIVMCQARIQIRDLRS